MFRINSIMNDSRDKVRVHDFSEDSHNNYYTILTGDNTSGKSGNDSNLLIVFYVQIMPDDFVMQLHRF